MIELPSHKPAGYRCPFCTIAGGAESEFTAWRDEHVMVQIALHWNPANPGKALVIPLAHHENVYTLPDELASGQDVWHLHTHVIPRYIGDGKYLGVPVRADDRDRARYAVRLRELLR